MAKVLVYSLIRAYRSLFLFLIVYVLTHVEYFSEQLSLWWFVQFFESRISMRFWFRALVPQRCHFVIDLTQSVHYLNRTVWTKCSDYSFFVWSDLITWKLTTILKIAIKEIILEEFIFDEALRNQVLISGENQQKIPTRKMFLRFFKQNPDLAPTGTPNVNWQCQKEV